MHLVKYIYIYIYRGHAVAQLVEALRYKPEGRGFDSRWCHRNFIWTGVWSWMVTEMEPYFSLFPTRYTILFRLHKVSAILFPLRVSGLTGPSSGGLNCTCSLWYSPPLQMSLSCGRWERVLSYRPHDKDVCRGGEYHRLHVQFRPPDDGPVSPETCRAVVK